MYAVESRAHVENCTFITNSAGDQGGGMMLYGTDDDTMSGMVFSGNSAPNGLGGGMLKVACQSLAITNCVFAENSAGLGGAVANQADSRPVVTNATFSGNTAATAGGALYNSASFPTVTNSILWADTSNGAVSEVDNVEGSSAAITYCTVAGGCALGTCTSDDTANLSSDPLFVDAAQGDYRLQSGSPCIDTGNGAVLPSDAHDLDADGDTAEATPDLAGRDRVLDGNGDDLAEADRGAYEF